MKKLSLTSAAAAVLFCGGLASAQPLSMDIGLVTPPGYSNYIAVGGGMVTWIRMEIPEASVCQLRYLDINTNASGIEDSEIALYDSVGNLIASDDDDGAGTWSALSFGVPTPLRPLTGGGRDADGRDGPLPAGVYYLALAEFNSDFLPTNWEVIPSSEGFGGGVQVTIHLDTGVNPSFPADRFDETLCAGDGAGSLPQSAGSVSSASLGPVSEIRGRLNSYLDVDMYKVCITDPASFSANTFFGTAFDSELFLFDASGRGVTLNDDADETLQSLLTSTVVGTRNPGEYYLAVVAFNNDPFDSSAQALWDPFVGGERPADGPGALNPVAAWQGEVIYAPGAYTITLQGVTYCAASTCGSADFDGDGDTGTDADIEAFFACLAGNCCATCGSADFDGDGDTGTDADIEAFFRVLAGGTC
jgi:hypothetical protein